MEAHFIIHSLSYFHLAGGTWDNGVVNLFHLVLLVIVLLICSLPISSGRAGSGYQNIVAVYDDILTRIVSVYFLCLSLFDYTQNLCLEMASYITSVHFMH